MLKVREQCLKKISSKQRELINGLLVMQIGLMQKMIITKSLILIANLKPRLDQQRDLLKV